MGEPRGRGNSGGERGRQRGVLGIVKEGGKEVGGAVGSKLKGLTG